jgi:Ca-activated chloride channel family protein
VADAPAVAEFGLLLRDSEFKGSASYDAVIERAEGVRSYDHSGPRREFAERAKRAKELAAVERVRRSAIRDPRAGMDLSPATGGRKYSARRK